VIKKGRQKAAILSSALDAAVSARCKERLDAALGKMPAWAVHDIRRTVASGMGDLAIAPHVIEGS